MNQLIPIIADHTLAAQIRNPNTRSAYARAAKELLACREQHRVASIAEVQPTHVAATSEGPRGANAACR